MKTIRMSVVLASMAGAATLFLAVPASMSASDMPDWKVLYTGEPIAEGAYQGTAMSVAPGQEFDLFNTGEGIKVEDFAPAYRGTSMGSESSDGWDAFRVGEGDPLP